MSAITKLTLSSMKMFLRNRQAVFFTLVMPLFIMVIFGLIGFDDPQQFDIGLVSGQPGQETQAFIDQVRSLEVFDIADGSRDEQLAALKEGDLVAVLEVPDDFMERRTDRGSGASALTVHINESQQPQAQAVVSIMSRYLDRATLAIVGAPELFEVKQEVVDSRNLKYIDFLMPGLIAMSVMQMSVFSVAFVFVQHKERGVLKRLLATPMEPLHFVASNSITRLVVSLVQTAIFILVGVLILDATVVGSYWLVALCAVFGALMFLGLGFTISGIAKTVESVPALANLIVFPMLFLGGTFFPISGMPEWLQKFANVLPLTPFSTALREVMTKDAGLRDIGWDLAAMAVWSIVLIALATVTFSFQEKDSA